MDNTMNGNKGLIIGLFGGLVAVILGAGIISAFGPQWWVKYQDAKTHTCITGSDTAPAGFQEKFNCVNR